MLKPRQHGFQSQSKKERVVVERVTPADANARFSCECPAVKEVAHIQIYEETPDIRKETAVGEEVRIRKEVEQDTLKWKFVEKN